MPLTLKQINQLQMAKTPIAAELKPSNTELRSWVAVYPPNPLTGKLHFGVRRFEIKKEMVDADIHQEDLINAEIRRVQSIEQVEKTLEEWGINSTDLSAPWNCDYPL